MEILTLLGSPRKKGNTAAVLEAFEGNVSARHKVQRINIVDRDLRGCLGCDWCQRNPDQPCCAQKDDANAIFERMIQADVLVYASPLYVWDFSAQMKTLLDRQYCLTKWQGDRVAKSFLSGKRAMLLVTCGGGIENNADVIQVVFERAMDCTGCEIVGKYILPDCSTPKELGVRGDEMALKMVRDVFLSSTVGFKTK